MLSEANALRFLLTLEQRGLLMDHHVALDGGVRTLTLVVLGLTVPHNIDVMTRWPVSSTFSAAAAINASCAVTSCDKTMGEEKERVLQLLGISERGLPEALRGHAFARSLWW